MRYVNFPLRNLKLTGSSDKNKRDKRKQEGTGRMIRIFQIILSKDNWLRTGDIQKIILYFQQVAQDK